jgi:tRNA nucleotidyltransferase (CCA-adding enzyme)
VNIIIGHSNMDLDSIGALVLARRLFPDHRPVRSRFIHPAARNLYNLYRYHLDFMPAHELKDQAVEEIIIVDTRSSRQVEEYFAHIPDFSGRIEVFDHHAAAACDLPRARLHDGPYGATTTLLGLQYVELGMTLSPEDATIALAGIYADTGNFTHETVTAADFQVASFLLRHHASLRLVKTFLTPLKAKHQVALFYELLNTLSYKRIHGHSVLLGLCEMEKQASGLADIVDQVFGVENPDALFAVFAFKKEQSVLIVGRSQKEAIAVNKVLGHFHGGGHAGASSALLKNQVGSAAYEALERHLHDTLAPAATAEAIMSRRIAFIGENWTLKDASIFLEKMNHTGAPVVDTAGELVGIMTLRDIMKGRKAAQMHAPVKGYMTRKLVTAGTRATVREIEDLLFLHNIGHLPIVEEGKIVGIVTRSDYLSLVRGSAPGGD